MPVTVKKLKNFIAPDKDGKDGGYLWKLTGDHGQTLLQICSWKRPDKLIEFFNIPIYKRNQHTLTVHE